MVRKKVKGVKFTKDELFIHAPELPSWSLLLSSFHEVSRKVYAPLPYMLGLLDK